MQDTIRVNDLSLTIALASGAHWPQKTPVQQPVLVTLSVPYDVRQTASTDDLSHSINYAALAKQLRKSLDSGAIFGSLEDFASYVFDTLLGSGPGTTNSTIKALHISITQLKSPLHSKAVGLEASSVVSTVSHWSVSHIRHFLKDIECHAIIGVNDCEREEKQIVKLNVSVEGFSGDLKEDHWLDFRGLTRTLYESIGNSSFLTLEALASYVATKVLQRLRSTTPTSQDAIVTIKAAKPNALVFASSSEVELSRTFDDYPDIFLTEDTTIADAKLSTLRVSGQIVAIALGSNVGDSFHNIELALRLLEAPDQFLAPKGHEEIGRDLFVTVVDTSFLYETAPMYVTDQPSFINCACLVETNISPVEFLKLLKHIESAVGRVPSIRNGPRAVDLDIVFYGNLILDTRPPPERESLENLAGQLVVPHPRMQEREFVLRPLNDMIPDYIHPVYKKPISKLLAELPEEDPLMKKVVPFPRYPLPPDYAWSYPGVPVVPPTLTHWTHNSSLTSRLNGKQRKTHLMATLNATPDSFSDGSDHNTMQTALEYARKAIEDGSTIIDIGGYSTKPGAAFVTPEEEEERVVPIIKAMRNMGLEQDLVASKVALKSEIDSRLRVVPISVDTFRWEVAKASILAGANCINDVYAFTGRDTYPIVDDNQRERAEASMAGMKRVARDYAVPVILMHSRGDAGTNKDYRMYESNGGAGGAVVQGVQVELGAKVENIIKGKGGVRRWMVIVDPGVGFSKTLEGNLEVLRDASSIVCDVQIGKVENTTRNPLCGYPLLIGASRKSFLGVILAQGDTGRATEPAERVWATSAAVACAVQQGSLVIRVHDTKEMADVISVAGALWG